MRIVQQYLTLVQDVEFCKRREYHFHWYDITTTMLTSSQECLLLLILFLWTITSPSLLTPTLITYIYLLLLDICPLTLFA